MVRINCNSRVKDLENNQKNLQEFNKTNIKNLELYVKVWDQNIIFETHASKKLNMIFSKELFRIKWQRNLRKMI